MEISIVFGTLSHIEFQGAFRNGGFYRVVWRSFSTSVIRKHISYEYHVYFKMFEIWCRFPKSNKILRKRFSFFRYLHLNWESQILVIFNMILGIARQFCQQIHLRFHLTLGETFSKSTYLRMMNKLDKCAVRVISQSIWHTFTWWRSKRFLKHRFLESGLTKIFKVCNFRNALAMTIMFFFKMFEIWCRFQKSNKKLRKRFSFFRYLHFNWELLILLIFNRYFASAGNVSTNTPKISPNTRRDIFRINFPQNDEKRWKKCSDGCFESIWDTFTCWLSKRFLKRRFLERALTRILTVCKFVNTLAISIIIFFQNI